MTEEERQKTILELERQVLGEKPWDQKPKIRKKERKCEVCGNGLINGDCPEHPVHIRMHHNYLMRMRQSNG